MYGQRASFGALTAGITVASWWMLGVTIALTAAAIVLLVRVFITVHAKNASLRP